MSSQSAPGFDGCSSSSQWIVRVLIRYFGSNAGGPLRCPWYLFHRLF
ncbi:unnamed protein product [Staurois parvus]|uniref:Uncharacterized protein n=1 Tax=Staurois parvus TaxID=386267 RepID=A0ABN9CX75_9NEOB|nr:unnamed protein product [Staurois parvus]